jgi:TRAP-type C4-dicarboxylate transport system permease small subunit
MEEPDAVASPTSVWARRWRFFAEMVAAVLFAAMFAGFMIQIISRYIFNDPVSWSLELCSIAYVWVVFWTCDILVEERQHIIFDVLYEKFPPRWRRYLGIFNTASLGLVFLAILPSTIGYVHFMARRHSTVMHVRMDLVYACFAFFVLAVVVAASIRLWRLSTAGWERRL